MSDCKVCGRELDNVADLRSKDCGGGDCVDCVALCGDPAAIMHVALIERIETLEKRLASGLQERQQPRFDGAPVWYP